MAIQGTLWYAPVVRMFQGGTNAVPNAQAFFYLAGTSSPVSVHSDISLMIALPNPVVADANGVFPPIFLTPGTAYKIDVQTSAGVSLPGYPADNQLAPLSSASTVGQSGIAGEAISAGQSVYLSAGDGSKVSGQYYLASAAQPYSSSIAQVVGIAPAAIAAGATGTVVTVGQVGGLVGLTAGTDYYVGTIPGGLTSTAPPNLRYLGRADSTTSILLQNRTTGPANQLGQSVTVGVAVAAGQAVYRSDGSIGGTTSNVWYLADASTPGSSSTAQVVGIALASIASGSVGTVTIVGAASPLTGLTAGTDYYVGTAGALTATPPANARYLGRADATSTPTSGTLNLVGQIPFSSLVLFSPDNTIDVGASSTFRPRDLWLGRNASVVGTLGVTGATTLSGATVINNTLTTNNTITSGARITSGTDLVTQGTFYFIPDNTFDIGAGASFRPRDVYIGRNLTLYNLVSGGTLVGGGTNPITAVRNGAPVVVTLPDVASQSINVSTGTLFSLTTTSAARTISGTTGTVVGQKLIIEFYAQTIQSTLTLNGFGFGADIPALTPTPAGHIDYIGCVCSPLNGVLYVVGYTRI